MSLPNQTDKLKLIYQLLFDLATGRKTVDIGTVSPDDVYDQILINFSSHGKRLRELVLENGMVPPYYAFQHLSQFVFVLDSDFRIIDFNETVIDRLQFKPETLRNLFFEELLDIPSRILWNTLKEEVSKKKAFFITTELMISTFDGHKLPLLFLVTTSHFEQFIYAVSVEFFLKESNFFKNVDYSLPDRSTAEVAVIDKLHQYILSHLDEPLPTLKALAFLFDSEEHKLKRGFRQYYNTSVYQFYQDERLKKSYQLIIQTKLPLKEIAYLCGFGMYLNFYKAFRKKYGFSPRELKRG